MNFLRVFSIENGESIRESEEILTDENKTYGFHNISTLSII